MQYVLASFQVYLFESAKRCQVRPVLQSFTVSVSQVNLEQPPLPTPLPP
jgi:hypothetical protein